MHVCNNCITLLQHYFKMRPDDGQCQAETCCFLISNKIHLLDNSSCVIDGLTLPTIVVRYYTAQSSKSVQMFRDNFRYHFQGPISCPEYQYGITTPRYVISQKNTDVNETLVQQLMFSAVYSHQPQQTYVILNHYTKYGEENTLQNPMLSVNDSTPLGPIKQNAIGPCP